MVTTELVCLQIHNDYQIEGGETKTAKLIADLLEQNGVKVIRYYKTNKEYIGEKNLVTKIKRGLYSLYNPITAKEIDEIIQKNHVDFALVHNVVSVISNSAYKVLIKRRIPIIKYIQNYNLLCLNGALDHFSECDKCRKNSLVGVKNKCYKGSRLYTFIKYLIKRDMDRNVLTNIAAFMPNSEYVGNIHEMNGIGRGKMHVMYNYIDATNSNSLRHEDYYLYYGRLSQEKGIGTLIAAFEKLPKCKLIIMGDGPLKQEVVKKIRCENIEYIGKKEGSALVEAVGRAKAVIVPSEWDEPLPRTILEAYSQSIPVIGANRGGISEMVSDGITGFLFPSGDVAALVNVVERFESLDSQEYLNMRKNCEETLQKKYSQEAYFERFINCVNTIIKSEGM